MACASERGTALLEAHKHSVATGGSVSTSVDGTGTLGRVQFRWKVSRGSAHDLLLMCLPHHRIRLVSALHKTELYYQTIKGNMIGVVGDTWTMEYRLPTIAFDSPRPPAHQHVPFIISALEKDADTQDSILEAADTYFLGKRLARLGRLIVIARHLKRGDVADRLVAKLRPRLEAFLNPHRTPEGNLDILYDRTYGGIMTRQARANSGSEFGQGIYNDHHYHYGYIVYSAAVLQAQLPSWSSSVFGECINTLIRDYANPNVHDSFFPWARHKDWFCGHSWASGLAEFGDAKNQESISEAVNAYYAVYLWGLVCSPRKDFQLAPGRRDAASSASSIADWGRLLLATEIDAGHLYWQVPEKVSSDLTVYPSPFDQNGTVGVLWSTKVDYATWFGDKDEYIHGIQMLPFTPISELLIRREWIERSWNTLNRCLNRPDAKLEEGWKGFLVMARAVSESDEAWKLAQELKDFDNGNSRTNVLYWIATRP